ncbi:MAG TPA: AraC family transcriptional regulator [Chloroflexota bacterium]|nr:AraC family transcriptional regulator [Chloroflexota bacterium]
MAPILKRSAGDGLERSCAGDWLRGRGPIGGVELLHAWFGGRAYASHRHDTYAISLTEVGVQTFDYRGQVERSLPGQVTVLHPDELHDGRAGTAAGFGYRQVYVEPAAIADAVRAITDGPAALPFVREPVANNPALATAVADAFRSPLEPLAIDALVLRLAEGLLLGEANGTEARTVPDPWNPAQRGQVARSGAARARRLDRAALARGREFLDSRRTTVVHSTELEAVTGLSRYELARQFRLAYGTSPHRYALLRRLDFARAQLHTGTPLADLALSAGFADQAHFTRMFRSAYGLTPGRYARLHSTQAT